MPAVYAPLKTPAKKQALQHLLEISNGGGRAPFTSLGSPSHRLKTAVEKAKTLADARWATLVGGSTSDEFVSALAECYRQSIIFHQKTSPDSDQKGGWIFFLRRSIKIPLQTGHGIQSMLFLASHLSFYRLSTLKTKLMGREKVGGCWYLRPLQSCLISSHQAAGNKPTLICRLLAPGILGADRTTLRNTLPYLSDFLLIQLTS